MLVRPLEKKMKAKTIILSITVIIVLLAVSGVLVIRSWQKKPYGTLHPNAALLLKLIQFRNVDLFAGNPPIDQARKQSAQSRRLLQKAPVDVALVRDDFLPGPEGNIPFRLYSSQRKATPPVIIYFHGGGWVFGSLDSHDNICRSLADKTDCMIICVDYRLAPETPFPGALEDAYAALLWVWQHGSKLNADTKKIIVAGDSAGGNLAAAVSLMARDKNSPAIAAQVLIYPVTNVQSMATESYQQFSKGYFLTKSYMEHFRAMYLPDNSDRKNGYVSVLLAASLKNLPPAIVITARFDPLRDEGEQYAKRLEQEGNLVSHIRYNGMIHGFLSMDRLFGDAENAVDRITAFLKPFLK